jgi:predicted GIY-YIG superfamily endonuclease
MNTSTGCCPVFTKKYGVNRLVHIESFAHIDDAIAREKALKGWKRARKIDLIEAENLKWYELSHDWFDIVPPGETGATAPGDPSLRSG